MLPLTTTTLQVLPAGEATLDAQRRRVHAAHGPARGPYGAVVSPVPTEELPPEERDVDVQLRLHRVRLQPDAWPVRKGDQLRDQLGQLWTVTGAELRDDLPQLEHVAATAKRIGV